ncbi:MAG TPA: glycerophosphodiester phosphodiesterase [Clostridiaceae bacterium]|nr:glycerophosphodiester phosphodiesterase [Clostridiaceae bacterium]
MTKIIAHRGFSGLYPENTILAFKKALELGADGAELDIQLTKDNILVVFHDESLLRFTGEDLLVKDLTYEELLKCDVSGQFKGKYGFQKIPTLEQYFDLVKDHNFLSILELKTTIFEYPGIEEAVIRMIYDYKLEQKVIISSFNHYTLLRCKAIAPQLSYGILYECRLVEPQIYAQLLGMSYLHPDYHFLNDNEIAKCKKVGIGLNAWTVDNEADMIYLLQQGIDAIMTNYPDRLIELKKKCV